MKVKEIKETVEKVVRTDYIAEDGKVFHDEEECKKYEGITLSGLSKALKMREMEKADCMLTGFEDSPVRIFDIQTKEELDKLKRYIYLKATDGISVYAYVKEENRYTWIDDDLSFLTYGHAIITLWNWDDNCCFICGDGSFNAYCRCVNDKMKRAIVEAFKEDSKE